MATNRIETDSPNGQIVTDSANQLDTDKVLSETTSREIQQLKAAMAATKPQATGKELPDLSLTGSDQKDQKKQPAPKAPDAEEQALEFIKQLKVVKTESDTNRDGYMSKEELTAYLDKPEITGFKRSTAVKTLSQFDALDNLRYGFWRDGRIGDGDIQRFGENSVVAALAKDGSPLAGHPKFLINMETVVKATGGFDNSASKRELRTYALDARNPKYLRETAAVIAQNYDDFSLGYGFITRDVTDRIRTSLSPDLGRKLTELNSDPKNHDDHAAERAVGGAFVGGAMGSLMSSGRGNYGFGGAMLGGAIGASSAESEWEKTYKRLKSARSHLRDTGLFQMDNQPLLDEK